jgi:hypothetical protein
LLTKTPSAEFSEDVDADWLRVRTSYLLSNPENPNKLENPSNSPHLNNFTVLASNKMKI